jgi:hypothetical protein
MGGNCRFIFHPGRFTLISDLPTDDGWLYLEIMLNLCARRITGRAIRDHIRAELSIAVQTMAIPKA